MTANLGTHTFFMAALPVCFWCGYTGVGRAYANLEFRYMLSLY
jgi:hypothetical protein